MNSIPVEELDEQYQFELQDKLNYIKNDDNMIYCVPFQFKDKMGLFDYSIPLSVEVVKKLTIHEIKGNFVILDESIAYDKNLGLLIE